MSPAPKKKKTTAAELRTWRVSILRGRANHLGDVQAPDAKASASLSYQRQIVFFAIASPFLFERHQHHLSLQHVPGLRTRMRVTANAYVWHDFGNADHCFEVAAWNLKSLILGLLGHRGRLLRAVRIPMENLSIISSSLCSQR